MPIDQGTTDVRHIPCKGLKAAVKASPVLWGPSFEQISNGQLKNSHSKFTCSTFAFSYSSSLLTAFS